MGHCSSKAKMVRPQSSTLNPVRLSAKIKHVLTKFTKDELNVLRELFYDLSRRTDTTDCIDKSTFLQFFPLPGLLGERLFRMFDTSGSGLIDFDGFLLGLAAFSKGTLEEKYKIIFNLYDLNEDGIIDKSELVTMIHNSFKETVTSLPVPENKETAAKTEDLYINIRKTSNRSTTRKLSSFRQNSTSCSLEPETYSARVHGIAKTILEQFGDKNALNFEDFKQFLARKPIIFETFSSAFKEDVWFGIRCDDRFPSTVKRGSKNHRTMMGPSSSLSFDEDIKMLALQTQGASEMSGIVYKKAKGSDTLEKKFATLKKSLLMINDCADDKMPAGVVFMEGCYVDIIGDFFLTNKFGITLSHQNNSYKEVNLWCDSRKERDEWVRKLEEAAKTRKFKEYYELGERIGNGKFSEVNICTEHSTGKRWAVKIVNKTKLNNQEKDMLRSEIAIMRLLDHPGVINLKEVFDTKKHMLIVMELVTGGELFQRIVQKKLFSEYAASQIIRQLLEVVSYLHDVGIIHRDIKPENILLADDSDIPRIKLADFGLSKLAGPGDLQSLPCGTLGYAAPEILSQQQGGYNNKVDIWSVGVIAYLLLHGRLPFDHKEKQVLIELTLKGGLNYDDQHWRHFTPYASDFIRRVLNKNPSERLSAASAIQHNWIKNADVMIPRAINKEKMEEVLIARGVTSTQFGPVQYKEKMESENDNSTDQIYDPTVVQSLPDIFVDISDMQRKYVENNMNGRIL
ncbi:unnamed protein product [Blepharisma stoltei]|uniref:Calmodulin n=1 Tax=Blepharisma stoltei TaxID=1481888 RepID=A0AAU9JNY9_9CILI|nr:unnamed protein product [Blepharisma stoltei]